MGSTNPIGNILYLKLAELNTGAFAGVVRGELAELDGGDFWKKKVKLEGERLDNFVLMEKNTQKGLIPE